ncbi:ABC transporter permease [Sutcliffiella rhizosphaerae]|uniref:ABC transporter permease n=1 Tax=Sutcliffiella rhizosphaerae TaxID=2880967 RepID=A0ABM8YMA8_9BACI|nr:hypothetical protein [Sutcliffiella rhizosphaerae]CAG9621008.1 hypothetical protein BACCIP111883_01780 [Sutcliffiella rhizosphaerae]
MKFLKLLHFEGAFTLKNWFFMLGPFIYLLGMALWFNNNSQTSTDFYTIITEFLSIGHTLSLGIIFLASVLAIRREKQTVLLDWTNSLPNSFLSIVLAKYLALFIYSSVYSLLFFATFYWLGRDFDKPFAYLMEQGIQLTIQSQLSYGVSIALGMVLAVLISNRIVYIIVFCAWMFGTFFMEGFIITSYNLYFLKTFHLNQFFLDSTSSDDWGYRLNQKEKLYSQVFVFFFSLLLLAITIIKSSTDRITSYRNKKWILFAIVVVITFASFMPYGNLWANRLQNYNYLKATAKQEEYYSYDQASFENFYDVESYHLHVTRTGNSTFTVHAELLIPKNDHSEINFSLYPTFEIESIKWNGQPISFEKKNYLIQLPPLEQENINRIEVIYKGSLNEWGYINSQERNYAFLHKNDMFFPSYIGWYPLPGDYAIYTIVDNEFDSYLYNILYNRLFILQQNLPDSDYYVELQGFQQQVYSSGERKVEDGKQVFSNLKAKGITLLSNQNVIEADNILPFPVISTPANAKKLGEELNDLSQAVQYFSSWLDISEVHSIKLAYLPSLRITGMESYPTNQLDKTLFFENKIASITYIDEELVDVTMLDLKTQLLSYMLFKEFGVSTNHSEADVLQGINEAYLVVLFKDLYNYEWDDFYIFNWSSSNYLSASSHLSWNLNLEEQTTLEAIDKMIDEYHPNYNERIILMIIKEIEKGNLDKVKVLLKEIYWDIQTNKKDSFTYFEWLNYWKNTFESG